MYCDTKLKPRTEKVDFLTKGIDFKASLPFDQAWSRASKNGVPGNQSIRGPRNMHLKVLKMAIFPFKKGRLRLRINKMVPRGLGTFFFVIVGS